MSEAAKTEAKKPEPAKAPAAKSSGKALQPVDEVKQSLAKMEEQFKKALPSHMPSERFVRVAQTAIQNNPDLLKADRHSLFSACMKSAQDGLLPDGQEAALVVYNTNVGTKAKPTWVKKVQYMPMVKGIRKKVRNSGEISNWSLQVVKENDKFKISLGDDEGISHEPALSNRGKTIGAYSIVTLRGGEKSRDFMSVEDIEKIRDRSKSAESGPWVTDYDEMCKKTVCRRHSKTLPMSTDLEQVVQADDELFNKEPQQEALAAPEKTKSSRLSAIINAEARDVTSEEPEQEPVQEEEQPPLPDEPPAQEEAPI